MNLKLMPLEDRPLRVMLTDNLSQIVVILSSKTPRVSFGLRPIRRVIHITEPASRVILYHELAKCEPTIHEGL